MSALPTCVDAHVPTCPQNQGLQDHIIQALAFRVGLSTLSQETDGE